MVSFRNNFLAFYQPSFLNMRGMQFEISNHSNLHSEFIFHMVLFYHKEVSLSRLAILLTNVTKIRLITELNNPMAVE